MRFLRGCRKKVCRRDFPAGAEEEPLEVVGEIDGRCVTKKADLTCYAEIVSSYRSIDWKSANTPRCLALKSGQQITIAVANQQYLKKHLCPANCAIASVENRLSKNSIVSRTHIHTVASPLLGL